MSVLGDGADQRDHELGDRFDSSPLRVQRRFKHGTSLHLNDVRRGDAEAATPEAEHWVGLAQSLDGALAVLHAQTHRFGQIGIGSAWHKLMKRWVQHSDGHGQAVHCREDSVKILALQWKQILDRILLRLR